MESSLTVEKNEFGARIIGHSGCGKSRHPPNIVAVGAAQATRGVVFLEGNVVDKPGPDRAVGSFKTIRFCHG